MLVFFIILRPVYQANEAYLYLELTSIHQFRKIMMVQLYDEHKHRGFVDTVFAPCI